MQLSITVNTCAVLSRAAGLIALTQRLTRLSINKCKKTAVYTYVNGDM